MNRLVLLFAALALLAPTAALGKGPTGATMDGPGAGAAITFSGDEGSGRLGNLVEQSGWFAAAFEQAPTPTLAARPQGDLGPGYTVAYTVPGGENDTFTILQDIYPYAKGGPVTYMEPGQPLFNGETRGGWYRAGQNLKETLVAAGLPASPPAAAGSGDSSFPVAAAGTLVLVLLLLGASAIFLRRRARPAPAA